MATTAGLRDELRHAGPDERRRLLESYLRDQVASHLGLAPSRLDIQVPLNNLGLDSLVAVDLRTQVELDMGIVLPVVQLLDGATVARLADWLADQLTDESPTGPEAAMTADTRAAQPDEAPVHEATNAAQSRWMDLLTQVREVSDDDVDELLQELLTVREGQND
jgi:phthiocerol/phenolphthiocerol synthesis type-I polyketide synthase C